MKKVEKMLGPCLVECPPEKDKRQHTTFRTNDTEKPFERLTHLIFTFGKEIFMDKRFKQGRTRSQTTRRTNKSSGEEQEEEEEDQLLLATFFSVAALVHWTIKCRRKAQAKKRFRFSTTNRQVSAVNVIQAVANSRPGTFFCFVLKCLSSQWALVCSLSEF